MEFNREEIRKELAATMIDRIQNPVNDGKMRRKAYEDSCLRMLAVEFECKAEDLPKMPLEELKTAAAALLEDAIDAHIDYLRTVARRPSYAPGPTKSENGAMISAHNARDLWSGTRLAIAKAKAYQGVK